MDTASRHTFRYAEKLHLQKDFQHVLKSGRRLAHPAILVFIARRDGSGIRRLGLITGRKLGTAVERNRLKRRLREIFRLHKQHLAPGVDVIFLPRSGSPGLNYRQLESIVLSLLAKAGVVQQP